MRPFSLLALVLVGTTVVPACQPRADAGASSTVSDSAGVTIVVSERPAWTDAAAWRIEPAPVVEIGVESGEEPYQLNRVFNALRLPDGRILVGNSGSGEIRVFDSTGTFVRSIGRRGNGPGEFAEFSTVQAVRAPDGSLAAYDGGNLRLHYFDSSGTYLRTVRIASTAEGLRAFFQSLFGDGSWLTLALQPELRNEPGTYRRSAQQYVRFNADGTPRTVLRHVEGRTRFVHQFGDIVHFPYVPFTAEPLAAAKDDDFYVVPNGKPELEVRDLEGRLARVVRLNLDLPRTADVYARFVEASLATMDSAQRAQYAHYYGLSHPLPERIPAFQGMLVADDSHVWLERYRLPGDTVPRWEIVAPDGRWLGTVSAPPRFRLFQVGPDWVLGRHLDTLGVERARVHRLARPGP